MPNFKAAISRLSAPGGGGSGGGGVGPGVPIPDLGWRNSPSWAGWDHTQDGGLFSLPATTKADFQTSYDDCEIHGVEAGSSQLTVRRYALAVNGELVPVGTPLVITSAVLSTFYPSSTMYTTLPTPSGGGTFDIVRMSATRSLLWFSFSTSTTFYCGAALLERTGEGFSVVAMARSSTTLSVQQVGRGAVVRVGDGLVIGSMLYFDGSSSQFTQTFGIQVTGNALTVTNMNTQSSGQTYRNSSLWSGSNLLVPTGYGTAMTVTSPAASGAGTALAIAYSGGSTLPAYAITTPGGVVGRYTSTTPVRNGMVASLGCYLSVTYPSSLSILNASATIGQAWTVAMDSNSTFGTAGFIRAGGYFRLNDTEGVLVWLETATSTGTSGAVRAARLTIDAAGTPTVHQKFELFPSGVFSPSTAMFYTAGTYLPDGRLLCALGRADQVTAYFALKA